MADMGHQFWTSDGRLSMIGQGRNVVVLILLVFLVAAICARGRQLKLRIGCIGVLSLVCFVGYNLMLALSYGFIFKPDQAVGLVDYNRYIYTYYIGWFFMALACWSTALQTADGEQKAPARRWIALAGQAGVLLMAAAMLVRVNGMILPQLSVLGFSDGEFADRKTARAEADWLCSDYLNENDRVFLSARGITANTGSLPCLILPRPGGLLRRGGHAGGRRRNLRPAGAGTAGGGREAALLPPLHR